MALTNAERQARHRARMKERLAAVSSEDNASDELHELLAGQYIAAGRDLILHKHSLGAEPWHEELLAEFLAKPPTVLDMVEAMQKAGQKAALEIVERYATEYIASLPKPPPEPEPKRRRKRAGT
ncbi:hypothetical protein A33M_2908 [Rhodovulum sp. PH10]|uniref:hypothetical protein n=1 Tax=Rhodovulum sp. PH10 TaxID=1187851 RepID=UPI00027C2B44|nr:hypothetical protein [Rhodovulum sp. PH10]EJW11711.1 hypothetical protein A33M_2908 [Rhodovulum sp. PH10]